VNEFSMVIPLHEPAESYERVEGFTGE